MKKFKTYCWRFYWMIEILVDIVYHLVRAIVIKLPSMFIRWMLTEPQDEKPSPNEIIEAEDKVLDDGGAFAESRMFLV